MIRPSFVPFPLWTLGLSWNYLLVEAQTVIWLRLWGMAGVWSVAPDERHRMVSEKAAAFTESAWRVTHAMAAGKRPDEVMSAALIPIRRKTRSNSRRLVRRGVRRA